jgi:hypothetical protein
MNNQKNTSIPNIEKLILTTIPNQSLMMFKLLFGIAISFFAIKNIYYDFINLAYIKSDFFWPIWPTLIQTLPKSVFSYFNIGTLIFGIQIARQRWGNWPYWGYLLCIIPLFTFNTTYYLDHQLLLIIIALLLSLTSSTKEIENNTIQIWEITLFKLLFSGVLAWRVIAYLNINWLSGVTIKAMIKGTNFNMSSIPDLHWFLVAISIGMLIFEICFALIPWKFPKSVPWFWIGLFIYFQINNLIDSRFAFSQMPLLFFILSTLFLSPTYPKKILDNLSQNFEKISKIGNSAFDSSKNKLDTLPLLTKSLILTYVIIQLIIPLNIHTILLNHRWHLSYQPFAWTMKKQITGIAGEVIIVHPTTKEIISRIKVEKKTFDTSAIFLIYIHRLRDEYKKKYGFTPEIYADVKKSVNLRPWAQYTDPTINLAHINYKFGKYPSWVLPQPDNYFK